MAAIDMKVKSIVCLLALILLTGLCRIGSAAQEAPGKEQTGAAAQVDQSSAAAECSQAVTLLQQQKALISRELGQLKREMALLREDISEPGLTEVFAGIGYILGLAGVAFFVYCRKKQNGD